MIITYKRLQSIDKDRLFPRQGTKMGIGEITHPVKPDSSKGILREVLMKARDTCIMMQWEQQK